MRSKRIVKETLPDRKAIDLTADEKQSVVLNARNLPEGTNHLIIRMDRQDPLALDNERYVSVLAAPPKPTLVVASDPDLAFMLRLIADPQSATDETKTQARSVNYAQLANVELSKYPVVCLLDPPPLSNRDAEALRKHVENGGGLLQLLGPSLGSPANVNNNAIEALLPGKDVGIIARDFKNRSGIFDAIAVSHPIFYTFGEIDPPWQNHPIFKSWTFGEMVDNAQVLAKATLDDAPLVISHPLGRGQVMTVCTPIPQPDVGGDAQWNELWIGDDPWPAFYLLSGMLHTLSGADRESLNYQVGTPVSLANAAQDWPRRWELFLPDAQSRRIESQDELLTITDLSQAGTYRMRGLRGDPKVRGFSINVPAADTMMQRVTEVDLDSQLGAGNYRIAVNRDELESSVGQSRFGRELYPLMMIFVAGLFLAEQAMSNRFYKINFSRTRKA